jgi:hypothetical protein
LEEGHHQCGQPRREAHPHIEVLLAASLPKRIVHFFGTAAELLPATPRNQAAEAFATVSFRCGGVVVLRLDAEVQQLPRQELQAEPRHLHNAKSETERRLKRVSASM